MRFWPASPPTTPAAAPITASVSYDVTAAHRPILWIKAQLLQDLPGLRQISGPEEMRPIQSVSFHNLSIGRGTLAIGAIGADVLTDLPERTVDHWGQFAGDALFAGASAVILDCVPPNLRPYAPVFLCPNRKPVFQALARIGRNRLAGHVVGITGSYGKTTTREVIAQMLSAFASTSTASQNRNSLSGICETLSSASPSTANAVLELGISVPDTMHELSEVARPDIAVLLTVVDSHLGNYPSQAALMEEQARILDNLTGDFPALIGRAALELDRRLETHAIARRGRPYLTVGTTEADDLQVLDYAPTDWGSRFRARIMGDLVDVVLPVAGRHIAISALFALGVAHLKGLPLSQAIEALHGFRPLEQQRGMRWRLSSSRLGVTVELINDAQNASPDTLRALLDNLRHRRPRRLVFVMGDMAELGPEAEAKHRALAPQVQAARPDLFIAVGPLSEGLAQELAPGCVVAAFPDVKAAKRALPSLLQHGDLVVLKASAVGGLGRLRSALAPTAEQAAVKSAWRIEDDVPRLQ